MRTRARRLCAAAVACGALLTIAGCGSSALEPDFHTGAAAVVGDEEISLDEVDETAEDLCHLVEPQLQANNLVWSMAKVRAITLDSLLTDILTRRFAEDRGLEPGPGYDKQLQDLNRSAEESELGDRDVETANSFNERDLYHAFIVQAAAQEELGSADEETLQTRGEEIFQEWVDEVDLSVDPRFGRIERAQGFPFTPSDGDLSVAVSELAAKSDAGEERDPEYAKELPPDQRCG